MIFKKLTDHSTFVVCVIFLLEGVVRKSCIVIFIIEAINNDLGFVHYALPLESNGDAQQVCSWVLMVAHTCR